MTVSDQGSQAKKPAKAIAFNKNVFRAMRIWVAKAIWEFRNMNRVWQSTARNLGGSF